MYDDIATRAEAIEVKNPATGEVIGTVPAVAADEGGGIVARARAGQPGWEALGFGRRAQGLKRAQKWLGGNGQRLAPTGVAETGKGHEDARRARGGFAA